MARKIKDFDERKMTVGVSLSNSTLKMLDEFCCNYRYSRSYVIETLLRYYSDKHDEFYTIIDDADILQICMDDGRCLEL